MSTGAVDSVKVREEILKDYPQVWTTDEMQKDFEVLGFSFGYCVVARREDGQKGTLDFIHSPRFYYNFFPVS
jgi:hypothetical protein